jgi:hypothetical protein
LLVGSVAAEALIDEDRFVTDIVVRHVGREGINRAESLTDSTHLHDHAVLLEGDGGR